MMKMAGLPKHLFVSSEMRIGGLTCSFTVKINPVIPAADRNFAIGLVGLTFGGALPERERGVWMLTIDAVEDRHAAEGASSHYQNTMAIFHPSRYNNLQFNPIRWAQLPKRNIDRIRVSLRRADAPEFAAMTVEEGENVSVHLELVVSELANAITDNNVASASASNPAAAQEKKIFIAPMYGGICHLNVNTMDC